MSDIKYIIRAVDQNDGRFRFATDLKPGLAPTVTREVRDAKRYASKSAAERSLAAFRAQRAHDDGFEVVPDVDAAPKTKYHVTVTNTSHLEVEAASVYEARRAVQRLLTENDASTMAYVEDAATGWDVTDATEAEA